MQKMLSKVLPFLLPILALSNDPSGGWLSYAVYNAPNTTDVITRMSATQIVPPTPKNNGGSPAFWFGLQTDNGDGALVQPIMSKWLGDSFYMFQEIFDWTSFNDHQTTPIKVSEGDIIQAEVTFVKESNTYKMTMNSSGTKETSTYEYQLLQTKTESQAYFVLEHQPNNCNELPPNGMVSWTNIEIDVNYEKVQSPTFLSQEESPKCGSKAIVVDSSTVNITWNA